MRWKPLSAFLLFEFALAGDGQGLVLDTHVDILQIDIRQVGFQNQLVFGLVDIDGGRPGPVGPRLIEQRVKASSKRRRLANGSKWVRDMVLKAPHYCDFEVA